MSYQDKNIISPDIPTQGDENTFEETVMDEESELNQKIHIIKKEISFEEKSTYEDERTISTTKNSDLGLVGIKQEWIAETEVASKPLDSVDSEDERTEFFIEKAEGEEEDDDEEETIAMFVTASGQQLALYAVEDSDDYFAVAVYDESGEPPSNFQFLMKSDVERLIREGAVRTVKKPTQIKRQLVTTQPPVFIPKEEITGDVKKIENRTEPMKNRNFDNKKTNVTSNFVKPVIESPPTPKIVRFDDSGSEEELVEQSTVQYILCDGDQSDTELTFDEIQATLQELKATDSKKQYKNISIEKPSIQKKTNNGLVYLASPSSICNTSYRGAYYPNSVKMEPSSKPQSPVKRSHISNTSIIGSKQNHGIKRELSPMSDYYTPNISVNISLSDSMTNTNSQLKVKRPRKQQLTSVNREDTEIIIQPASMLEEEEEIPIPRKRGKRKKKNAKISKLPTRKSTRRRRTRVEIIDIDIDDSDSDEPPRRKEILEITLDENKEKGSSDKENEIIMVGDSDEDDDGLDDDDDDDDGNDEDEENDEDYDDDDELNSMKCKHCSKMFKHRRAFDSHTRICTKFRGRSHRLSERYIGDESTTDDESPREKKNNKKKSKDKSSKPKKEYTCKTCEEKFDMVVTLARHVRAEHTPRKRGRPSKADAKKLQMQIELNRLKNLERKNAEEKLQHELEKDDDYDDDDDYNYESEKDDLEKQLEELEKGVDESVEELVVSKELESEKDQIHEEEKEETEENPPRNELTEQNLEPNSTKELNTVSQSKLAKLAKKRKLIARLHRKWKFADLICTICNRWLPSASAHENHILQHFTKRRIARDIYECPICHKFFKSQLIYMKHKKLHTKVERNFKSEESEKFMNLQDRGSKLSAFRRCGRPRKLQSNI